MRSSNNAANTKCFYRNKISRHFQPWSSVNNLASFDEVNNESAPFHHTQLSNISNIIWNSTGKLAIFFKQQHYTPSLNSHIALLDLWFFSYLAEPASELCILPSIINHKSPGWIQPPSLLYYLFTACFRKIFLHVRNKRQNLILTWTPKKINPHYSQNLFWFTSSVLFSWRYVTGRTVWIRCSCNSRVQVSCHTGQSLRRYLSFKSTSISL